MNVPDVIKSKIGLNLHNKIDHPISIIKNIIIKYFKEKFNDIAIFDNLNPIVSTEDNFDLLRIAPNHPSRSKSDTYYIDNNTVLRTHTSAHQNKLLNEGYRSFLVIGDVYRKDEIDRYHYPVFHQMEGVYINNNMNNNTDAEQDLKKLLSGLAEFLFPGTEYRFNSDYFPFTEPSFEMEVKFNDRWLEILGCGIIHHEILDRYNIKEKGWAFGFGLERIGMIILKIPDIRLFWTSDTKFLSQFKEDQLTEFKAYPKLDPITRDISFWIPTDDIKFNIDNNTIFKWKKLNEFYELIREVCLDNIENVILNDTFFHSEKNKYSHTFRLKFTPNINLINPSEFKKMTDLYIKEIQDKINDKIKDLNIEIR